MADIEGMGGRGDGYAPAPSGPQGRAGAAWRRGPGHEREAGEHRPPGGRRRRVLGALLGLALVAAAVGCGSSGDGDGEAGGGSATDVVTPQPGGRLIVAVPLADPETPLRLEVEPLTTFAADGSVVPFLAESVEPNETFDRWTITVRPGITFHNGQPLDAAAVKANLDTYSVDEAYGTDPLSPITATTVIDDRTLEVELAVPWASFPASLTADQSEGTGLIASPETIEKLGPLFLAQPGNPDLYGTGPFVLEPQEAGSDDWLARRNPDYWQAGLPYVDEVELEVVAEGSARVAGVQTGDIDITITSRPPEDPGDAQVVTPEGDVQVLAVALNMNRPPLDDPSLREALVAATDVAALAETAGVDPSQVATGPFGPGSPWTDPDATPAAYDPDRASELVAAYEAANGPVSLRLAAQELEIENVAVQQQLAQQWTDAGIDVELSVVDPYDQTATLLVAGDFDAVLGRLFGLPDPDLYYFWWHSSARKTEEKPIGYNYVGVDDAELDAALDQARATTDEEVRRQAMVTVQQRLDEAMPYVWLWGARWSAVANERVRGLDDTPLPDGGIRMPLVGSRLNLEGVWLEQ